MDFSIIIRTFIVRDGVAYLSVGVGIMVDSDPAQAHAELLQEAEALKTVLERL